MKDTPNLPGSSRMQMASTGGNGTNGLIKEVGGMAGTGEGPSKKITRAAGTGGLKKTNPYK